MLKKLLRRVGFTLVFSLSFMILMFVCFTAFYRYAESLSWLDSLYFTVITTRTIGFGDISPQTSAGKIGTIVNALLPATVFFGVSLVVMQRVIRRMEEYWRQLMMGLFRNHDIIVANGDLLLSILDEYEVDQQSLVVIAPCSYESFPELIRNRLPENSYLQGNPSRDEVLRHAGVERARSIIIASDDDSENIYTLVTVRILNPRLKCIVRVNRQEVSEKFRSVGADIVLPTGTMMGRMLSQAAHSSVVHDFLVQLHTHTMGPNLQETTVGENDSGKVVRTLFPDAIAVCRQSQFHYSLKDFVLVAGDVVINVCDCPATA